MDTTTHTSNHVAASGKPNSAPASIAGGDGDHSASDSLLASEKRFTKNLKATQPILWWGTLIGPFGLSAIMLLAAWGFKGWEYMVNLVAASGAIFFGLGRAVLLMGNSAEATSGWQKFLLSMSTLELSGLVIWLDTFIAFIMVFHASYLYRIPKIGPAMLALQEDGEFILSNHPWFRRFAWLGLIVFVLIPFAATGSVGGSIVGRILGLSRWATLSGVVIGSIASTGIVFAFAQELKKFGLFSGDSPWAMAAGIAFVLILAGLLNWRYRKVKARWAASKLANGK